MTEAEKKIVESILKYGSSEIHHKDSLKWKRREKLREMEQRGIVKLRIPTNGLYLSYGPGDEFQNFLKENNYQDVYVDKNQEEAKVESSGYNKKFKDIIKKFFKFKN